ncbi:DegV family protein [Natronospira bacteriovora]|uniref:DegV family protein n=1 Tax=Natronospira bacteriovora TaxID=3069753 RepID=A0ABU0W9N5_9GAMM|nr:DegV family protein [Natronospira sp. AB-CW4]MDQ2070730.1 DegV family protein [Natronospira sp. AB-CW4]
MKIGIVIDSACDLPQKFIEKHGLEMMPISLNIGSERLKDTRDPQETLAFYRRYLKDKDLDAETAPLSVQEITDLFLDNLALKYDRVLVITVSSARSPTYDNATKASYQILNDYKERREKAGIGGSFALRVLDSKTMFTGEAVLVHEACRLAYEEKLPFDELRPRIESLTQDVKAFLVPDDLYYVRNRARKKGDRSVGFLAYHVGQLLDVKPILRGYKNETAAVDKVSGFNNAVQKMMNIAKEEILHGLQTNIVCMSYAGNPRIIQDTPMYKDFKLFCDEHGVDIMLSIMSTTAAINLGPGSFSLAFISGKEEDE